MQNNTKSEMSYDEIEEVKTTLVSRNITVQGRRTSIRLEPQMWVALREVAALEECTIHDICTLVSVRKKQNTSLTAAIRVFIMLYFRAASTTEGHRSAGHGNFDRMKQRARVPDVLGTLFSNKKPSAGKGHAAPRAKLNPNSYNNDGYDRANAASL